MKLSILLTLPKGYMPKEAGEQIENLMVQAGLNPVCGKSIPVISPAATRSKGCTSISIKVELSGPSNR